ncbi:MAG: hypothetical protein PVF54_07360, partial [Anaerolineae bacterium]
RQAIRDQLAAIEKVEGATGTMKYAGAEVEGDPIKCVVVVEITPDQEFTFYKMACPAELQ